MSTIPFTPPKSRPYSPQGPPADITVLPVAVKSITALRSTPIAAPTADATPGSPARTSTAIVYCEGNFGAIDGKTANGLIRYSEKYEVLSVIDSEKAGQDTGMVLDGIPNGIPVCNDLADSLQQAGATPDQFIFGMAPASGMMSRHDRDIVLEAMSRGMNVVSGLHEFLNDDDEFVAAGIANNVIMHDVRKPRENKDLRLFSGRINEIDCPRIAVLGTDCAIGKRTTATILARALNDAGLKAVLIGTGQTGLMQGARYGIALDAVPSQFCAGELEAVILQAYEAERPDVIIIEGQGALSHPAFSTTSFILRGSCPQAVVLQHAPGRVTRCDFELMPMPEPATEINLIQTFAETKVIGLTINHERMSDTDVDAAIENYSRELGVPVTDALTRSPDDLIGMVVTAFPRLGEKLRTGKS